MLCEMHCRINGCAGSRGGSMHLIDKRVGMAGTSAIVGGAVPIATGAALAAQMKGEDRVVVVFLGDATTEEGVTSESLNFAALKKVPVVFFCENNFYSVQSPLATRQPPRDLHRWAASVSDAGRRGGRRQRARRARRDGRTRSRAREPAAARRSSRRRSTGSARTAAPATTARRGYRDEAEREAWEAVDPLTLFGALPDARRRCSTTRRSQTMEAAIAPRSPKRSTSR